MARNLEVNLLLGRGQRFFWKILKRNKKNHGFLFLRLAVRGKNDLMQMADKTTAAKNKHVSDETEARDGVPSRVVLG